MKALLAWVTNMRANLFYRMHQSGMSADQIAETSDLTADEVERIIWWKRTVDGEPNGGWL